jgi:hypothetical protein
MTGCAPPELPRATAATDSPVPTHAERSLRASAFGQRRPRRARPPPTRARSAKPTQVAAATSATAWFEPPTHQGIWDSSTGDCSVYQLCFAEAGVRSSPRSRLTAPLASGAGAWRSSHSRQPRPPSP